HAAAQIDERRRSADLIRQPRGERDGLRLRLGNRGGIKCLRSRENMETSPVGADIDQAADERRNLGGIDAEGLGAAAHLHPRTLEVEIGIDAYREPWRDAQMIRNR